MGDAPEARSRRPYRPVMLVLCALFALRVGAQFIVQFGTVGWLPPFEVWDSEVLGYPALLAGQLILLAAMAWGAFAAPFRTPRPTLAAVIVALGLLYFGVMLARMGIGMSGALKDGWFDAPVSTAFHFVLASYVIVLGDALQRPRAVSATTAAARIVRWAAYPGLIALALGLFAWLTEAGSPLLFSAYLAVAIGGVGVLLHESFLPYRESWRPRAGDVSNDAAFLVLIQVALPPALKAGMAGAVIVIAGLDAGAPAAALWPHAWPVAAQVVLMMLIAEFFRYWIHRLAHTWTPLWKLHAVHHAADKLYTVNVARFHPLDKAVQFLGDTAPFLLLGVGPEVFAAYFVFYAVNGFYQHSNADVRLGPLNWIIAGPELHRWHHSKVVGEAQSNYGNNLIIWDTVFGTRRLPRDRAVGALGIGNPAWPTGFLAQLAAPFRFKTDAE